MMDNSYIYILSSGHVLNRLSYDAWGRRRSPDYWKSYSISGDEQLRPMFDRGYTGHEHLDEFDIINMNGRLYNPTLGRFLSPDPYVADNTYSQDFNRYSYCRNNPMMYTDPDGEFIHLIVGAVIGGIINVAINWKNISNIGDYLKYVSVGMLSGALAAGVGAGMSAVLGGGSFGGGFWMASTTATSSFFSGAAVGGSSGLAGGFTTGFGNTLAGGGNIGDALKQGGKDGLIGLASGAVLGGIAGGIDALKDGRRFWDGASYTDDVIDHQLPFVAQGKKPDGTYTDDCGLAVGESTSQRSVTMEDIRKKLIEDGLGGDNGPYGDVDTWTVWKDLTGCQNDIQKGGISKNIIFDNMKEGRVIAQNLNKGTDVGHAIVVNRATARTITKISGKTFTKYFIEVMDPTKGQYVKVSGRSLYKALSTILIF